MWEKARAHSSTSRNTRDPEAVPTPRARSPHLKEVKDTVPQRGCMPQALLDLEGAWAAHRSCRGLAAALSTLPQG